jgi:hypothetical protein
VTVKLLPLQGYKSLKALNAFHTLLLGLKMLPAHMATDYETFYEAFNTKTEAEQETLLREAAAFVQLTPEEVEALLSFATDANGVPYGPVNIKTLGPKAIFEVIIAVCMEIGRIKIDLISGDEKKKSPTSPST